MGKKAKRTACYVRVSTVGQNEAGQVRDIERWVEGHAIDNPLWLIDKSSGDNLARPQFEKLQKAIFNGEVEAIVVWRLDRLSRSLRDGINVLCDWCDKGLRVVSVTQQIDFNGATGKMLAAVLLGIAEMEQETRRERQAAGIAAAREKGRSWGGSKAGVRKTVTVEQDKIIRQMAADGVAKAKIARAVGLSRPTIQSVLATDMQPKSRKRKK